MSGTFGGYIVRDTSRTIDLLTTGLLLRDQVMTRADRQSGQMRESQTQKIRSRCRRRGRLAVPASTPSWCLSARFSAASDARERKQTTVSSRRKSRIAVNATPAARPHTPNASLCTIRCTGLSGGTACDAIAGRRRGPAHVQLRCDSSGAYVDDSGECWLGATQHATSWSAIAIIIPRCCPASPSGVEESRSEDTGHPR